MKRRDQILLKKIEAWLQEQEDKKLREDEIETHLHDIRYDIENFLKGIRLHTGQFRKEIGGQEPEIFESLDKAQVVSKGEFFKEIERQMEAIRTGRNIPIAFSILGNSLFFLGEYGLATECFERSIAYLPIVSAFYNNLGCCYFKQRRWIKAKHAFQKALDLQPDYQEAEKNLEDAAREYSNQQKINYWMARGNRYFEDEAWDQAEQCYKKALEIGGQMPETLVNYGNVCFRKGEDKKAEEFYHRAIQEDSSYAPAFSSLGKLRLRQKDDQAAFENLQKAFELDDTLHDSLALMGDISFRWQNYPQALELYEAYWKLHPESWITLMLIGDCYLKMGKVEAARYAYNILKTQNIQSPRLDERLKMVEELTAS